MSEPESSEIRLTALESRLDRLQLNNSINEVFLKIGRDLLDLYSAVATAEFRGVDREGYVPERQVDHGWRNVMPGYEIRWYVPGKSAQQERLNAFENLASISQHLEEARATLVDREVTMDTERSNKIAYYINGFQHDLRHRLFEIDNCRIRFWKWSLNELAFCIRGIFISSCETFDYIDDKYRISTWEFESVSKAKE